MILLLRAAQIIMWYQVRFDKYLHTRGGHQTSDFTDCFVFDHIVFPSIVKLFEQTIRFRYVRLHGNHTVQDDIGNVIIAINVLIEKWIQNIKGFVSVRGQDKHEMT